jgi:hypothetical protein
MNKDIFDDIAQGIDSVLEKRNNALIKDSKDKTFKIIHKNFVADINDRVEANDLVNHMVEAYKNIVRKNNDFNTNIIAFANLYNYLCKINIIDKIDSNIIISISEIFREDDEREFFLGLLDVLNNPTKEAFLQLEYKKKEVEITYMYLAVIYMQKILDYRTDQKDKEYNNLAYCFSKIDMELKMLVLYGTEIISDKRLIYYDICLPYINVRELEDIEAEYSANINKNIEWEPFLDRFKHNEKKIMCYTSIAKTDKLYDEMGIIISRMGELLYEMREKNDKLKKLQEQRHNIIRDFSHTYENMQASGLKEIADILLENTDKNVQRCGRVILAEYGIKNSMSTEFNLLRLNFEDRREDIAKLISKGVYAYEREDTIKIRDIFENAFKICMLRIIYSGNPKGDDITAKNIYRRIKKKVDLMKDFVEQFENNVILGRVSLVEFLNGYSIPIVFSSEKEWNNIYFIKNGYAEILIRSIFSELIINFMKYSDLNEEINIKLKFNEGKFGILQTNRVDEMIDTDSGVGLSSKGNVLEKINGYKSYYIEPVKNITNDNIFKVLFLLDKNLFNRVEV